MRKRNFKSDVESLLAEGMTIINATDDAAFIHRVSMVNLVLAGLPATTLASVSGVDPRTIQLWVKNADENGFESLRDKKRTGRTPKLSSDIKEALKLVLIKDPMEYGYNVWDGISLSKYIQTTFGVSYSVRSCQRLFHDLGFSQIIPQTFPNHQVDQEAREAFKKNE